MVYADLGVDAPLDVVSFHTCTFTCCVANNRMLDPPSLQPVTSPEFISPHIRVNTSIETSAYIRKF